MGIRRLLFGAPAATGPSGAAWLDVSPGEAVTSRRGRPAVVRSVAVYETRDVDDPPGDVTHHVLVWSDESGRQETLLVQHDAYGGEGPFDVTTLHDLVAADPRAWPAPAPLRATELVGCPDRALDALPAEPQWAPRVRAAGPDARWCPSEAWILFFFRSGRSAMDRFWLVLYDRQSAPVMAFDATTRRGRAAGR